MIAKDCTELLSAVVRRLHYFARLMLFGSRGPSYFGARIMSGFELIEGWEGRGGFRLATSRPHESF